jgi:hypothetical protein
MGMVRARVLAVGLCFAAVGFGIGCGDAKADRTASKRVRHCFVDRIRQPDLFKEPSLQAMAESISPFELEMAGGGSNARRGRAPAHRPLSQRSFLLW